MTCGVITGSYPRERCLEPDPSHSGPHWKNVEPILCNCQTRCPGHDGDER